SWWGRHPVLSFIALPPLTLVVWFMGWLLLAIGLVALVRLLVPGLPRVTDSAPALLWGVYLIYYCGVGSVALFFWLRARRSYCAFKWGSWACGVCALHGWFLHLNLRPHSLSWAYGVLPADWGPVLVPLTIAALAHWRERRRQAGLLKAETRPAEATVLCGA